MASNEDLSVKVAVEAALHKGFATACEEFNAEYNIQVEEVHIEWEPAHVVRRLSGENMVVHPARIKRIHLCSVYAPTDREE